MTVLNTSGDMLKSVNALAYDPSGQYVALGGNGGVKITTVKKWGIVASIKTKEVSGMAWKDAALIATCSSKGRDVVFLGIS